MRSIYLNASKRVDKNRKKKPYLSLLGFTRVRKRLMSASPESTMNTREQDLAKPRCIAVHDLLQDKDALLARIAELEKDNENLKKGLCKGMTTRGRPCKNKTTCGQYCVYHRAGRCIDLTEGIQEALQKRKERLAAVEIVPRMSELSIEN